MKSALQLFISFLFISFIIHANATPSQTSSRIIRAQSLVSRDNGARSNNFVPEGIVFIPETNKLLISSTQFGSIISFNPQTGQATTKILGAGEGGDDPLLFGSIGLDYDSKLNLLFTPNSEREQLLGGEPQFNSSSISVVDLFGNRSTSVFIEGSKFANDLAYSSRLNSLFITDFLEFKIFRVDFPRVRKYYGGRYYHRRQRSLPAANELKVSLFSDAEILRPETRNFGPNGILVAPSGRYLITATSDGPTSKFIRFPLRRGQRGGRGEPQVVPIFDLEGKQVSGGDLDIEGYDGLEFGGFWYGRRRGSYRPTEIYAITGEAVLRFASFNNFRSLTLVETISTDMPECATSTTGTLGRRNLLYVLCTFGEPGEIAVLSIKIKPLARRTKRRIFFNERRESRPRYEK